jgi:hypothetical protein
LLSIHSYWPNLTSFSLPAKQPKLLVLPICVLVRNHKKK